MLTASLWSSPIRLVGALYLQHTTTRSRPSLAVVVLAVLVLRFVVKPIRFGAILVGFEGPAIGSMGVLAGFLVLSVEFGGDLLLAAREGSHAISAVQGEEGLIPIASKSEPPDGFKAVLSTESGDAEPAAELVVDVFGAGAVLVALIFGPIDAALNLELVSIELTVGTSTVGANPCASRAGCCACRVDIIVMHLGATRFSVPLEMVSDSKILFTNLISSGCCLLWWWWVVIVACWLFWDCVGASSLETVSMSIWCLRGVLMDGNEDTSSLLHSHSTSAAFRLNKISEIQRKESLTAALNHILNHRSDHGHVDAIVRVDHRRSPVPSSLSPRFDNGSHVHACLSPVKRTKNLRLNAPQPQVPSPIKRPGGPPACLSAGMEEALGCLRRGCSVHFCGTDTVGPRRIHPLLLCVSFLVFSLHFGSPCLVSRFESQRPLCRSCFLSHWRFRCGSPCVAKKLHSCNLGSTSQNLYSVLL